MKARIHDCDYYIHRICLTNINQFCGHSQAATNDFNRGTNQLSDAHGLHCVHLGYLYIIASGFDQNLKTIKKTIYY